MADTLAGVRVVTKTVVDPNLDLARTVAERYGFEHVTADLADVLDDPEIDAVSVALPNNLVHPTVTALLKAGKHVLSEKPLGRSAAEAEELAALAKASGLVAGVGFSYRRIPALAAAREVVATGMIGTPYFARATFYGDYALDPDAPLVWRFDQAKAGAGTLMDMGTHALDALEFFLGPVSEVTSALLDTKVDNRPLADGSGRRGVVDTDDTAIVTMRFGSGAVGTMLASRVAAGYPVELAVEVFGSTGRVSFSFEHINEYTIYQSNVAEPPFDGPRRIIPGPLAPHFVDLMPMCFRGNPTGYGEAFIAETQDFVRSIVHGTPFSTDFAAAVQTMQVAQAAIDSAASGTSVIVSH